MSDSDIGPIRPIASGVESLYLSAEATFPRSIRSMVYWVLGRTIQISTLYSIAIHILLAVEVFGPQRKITSDFVAGSVRTNPVVIRKIMLLLRDAELIQIAKGTGGITLLRPTEDLTLLDIYRAVEPDKDGRLFKIHSDTEPSCPVGGHIEGLLEGYFTDAQAALEAQLSQSSLATLMADLRQRWTLVAST